eukprot:SAG11_NODE_5942_length_1428_cov_2.808126_1_plen_49_part_00
MYSVVANFISKFKMHTVSCTVYNTILQLYSSTDRIPTSGIVVLVPVVD